MPIRKISVWRLAAGVGLWVVLTLVLAVVLCVGGGCSESKAFQGAEGQVLATYSVRSLTADMPEGVRVRTAGVAAESALRARGYIITRANHGENQSRVEAATSADGMLDKTVVESWSTGYGTAVSVTVEPFGDEGASRAILDAMLARLGR